MGINMAACDSQQILKQLSNGIMSSLIEYPLNATHMQPNTYSGLKRKSIQIWLMILKVDIETPDIP